MESHVAGDDSSVSNSVSAVRDRDLEVSTNVTTAWSSRPIVLCPAFTPTLLHRSLMHPIPWFSRRSRIMCSSALSWVLHYLLILYTYTYIHIPIHARVRTHKYIHTRARAYMCILRLYVCVRARACMCTVYGTNSVYRIEERCSNE